MKNFSLVLCLLLFTIKGFSQQYAQYNTGTLYDSFENPSQKIFTADTSKMFAFNFLVPNFNTNFYLSGNVQEALKTRLFSNYYNTANLQIGSGKKNHVNVNANDYSIMFKMFSSLSGNVELGFSVNTKAEAKGLLSDESVALFNGTGSFPGNTYNNIFNDKFYYQVYHQIGFTYREQITDKFALGIKLNALSGIEYGELDIDQSQITFDKPNDAANLSLSGRTYASSSEGRTFAQDLLPTFHNPGVSVTIGTTLKTEDGFTLQGNIKDLGFIHWNNSSSIYHFGGAVTINGLSTAHREDSIINKVNSISTSNNTITGFTKPTDGLLELSASRTYWLGGSETIKFSPTFIASKNLFYDGYTGALIAPFQYQKYVVTVTSYYNNQSLFNLGAQFMIKADNSEFFIGSERLFQTGTLLADAIKSSSSPTQPQTVTSPTGFTGMNFFIGFSVKFGPVLEHNMNTSYIPDGEKGFIGRLWEKIFPKDAIRAN